MAISATSASPVTLPVTRDPPAQPVKVPEAIAPQTPLAGTPTKPVDLSPAAPTSRRTTVDQSTGELVYQVIDDHSGQKVSQSPDEAILRIRAYARQMEAAKQPVPVTPKAVAKG